ncbi:unnamed protein product, partial [Prorocentrum cordatum]
KRFCLHRFVSSSGYPRVGPGSGPSQMLQWSALPFFRGRPERVFLQPHLCLYPNFVPLQRGIEPEPTPTFCGAELLYRTDEEPDALAHFAVGYEGVPWTHPDSITFMVMQSIIGSYKRGEGLVPPKLSGNRLTNNLANNLGPVAAESFAAFNTCYKDTGIFGFYGQCEEAAVPGCVDELLFGVASLARSVTEEEVERGKRQLKTTLFGSLDSTTAIAE